LRNDTRVHAHPTRRIDGKTRERESRSMTTLWIVHRNPLLRSALVRTAGAPEDAVCGAPGDPIFAAAPLADIVLLGLGGDLEAELEFAHQTAVRAPDARWILVPDRGLADAARELFDGIDASILSYPPDARTLRAQIRMSRSDPRAAAPSRRAPIRLSQRSARDSLAQRFARWFADLELPDLLLALDPHLGDVPMLILGEEGTGKGLLAHYVHLFGSQPDSEFAHVLCEAGMSAELLRFALAEAIGDSANRSTIWLENVDALPTATQRQLARWIEFDPPSRGASTRVARWIGTSGDEPALGSASALIPALRDALGGIPMRIPTLRERPERIAVFAADTALAWCTARQQRPRLFAEDALRALAEYPWPLNLRELEAVVIQTLAASRADPIRIDDLQYDGIAFAPIDASEIGTMIDADPGDRDARPADAPRNPLRAPRAREASPAPASRAASASDLRDAGAGTSASASIQQLVAAIAHEMRNPLSTIRTFAELLPSQYDDPEFRSRFAELVGQDTHHIEAIIQRLTELAALEKPEIVEVDISALLEELLSERTETVRNRELLVLKELDEQRTAAIGDAGQLRFALELLIDKSLDLAPGGGDVFIASRHQPAGLRGGPVVRVLFRFGNHDGSPAGARVPGTSPAENALEYAIAAAVIRSQGGTFTIDPGKGNETVLLIDIPA
jgi:DNA-binding NtrC family response regulator